MPTISYKKLRLPLTLGKSILGVLLCAPAFLLADTNLYWGGPHLHSSFSLDAYGVRNAKMTADMAYRFALCNPNSCNRYT